MGTEKSAEAIAADCEGGEGPNLLWQGAVGKTRWLWTCSKARGISLEAVVQELNSYLTGWVTYFRYAECKTHLHRLDRWIRHQLRCVQLKQRKRSKPIADFLQSLGVLERLAWLLALSGKGWWRMANSPQASAAMTIAWFKEQGAREPG